MLDNYWLNGCFPLFRPLGVNQKYSKDLNKISSFLVSNEWEVGLGVGEVSLERRRGKRFSLFFHSFISILNSPILGKKKNDVWVWLHNHKRKQNLVIFILITILSYNIR